MHAFYPIFFFGIVVLIALIIIYIKSLSAYKKIKNDPNYVKRKKK